jgi:multiple sugar transport system ATP-binding protein
MVFQSYALYPHMSVSENLAFGLRRRGFPRHDIERRVKDVAAALGLAELLHRRPHALSGGQRQRVALGRAIVRDPKVFCSTSRSRTSTRRCGPRPARRSRRLHRRLQATMIYVTHDQVEAMTLGDRICVMQDGKVAQIGPPLECHRRPANIFVARFLGSPPMKHRAGHLHRSRRRGLVRRARAALPASSRRRGGRGARCSASGPEETPSRLRRGCPARRVQAVELLGAETSLGGP